MDTAIAAVPAEPAHSEHGTLPLVPVESPRSWFVRMLYASTRARYGKTPTAFRVLYARSPGIALVSAAILATVGLFLVVPARIRFLVQVWTATQNDCTFCQDLQLAEAVMAKLDRRRFRELADFESSSLFDAREKAALAYATAIHASLHVDDTTWARLREHFDDRECAELVFLCAVERYFNSMAIPLRIGSDGLADSVRVPS